MKHPVQLSGLPQNMMQSSQNPNRELFFKHRICGLWNNSISHKDDAFHFSSKWSHAESDMHFENWIQIGFDYALSLCLKDSKIKYSEPPNSEQSKWIRAFGRGKGSLIAINPLDEKMQYEMYFGTNVAKDRIVYSSHIPVGNVLCFTWSYAYIHVKYQEDSADIWMGYTVFDNKEEPYNSLLVDMSSLVYSILDLVID